MTVFWRCFLAAYFIQAMLAAGFLFPVVLSAEGYSMSAIGWAMALLNLTAIASRPLGGWATEKKGFKGCLMLSGALSLIATAALWLIPGLPGALTFRIVLGAVGGIAMVAVSTLQGLVIPEKQRGRLFAIMGIAYVIPQLTVIPVGEWLLDGGRTWLYLMLPMLLTLSASAVSRGLPAPEDLRDELDRSEPWGSWRECLSTPGTLAMIITLTSFSIMNSTTLQYLPLAIRGKGLSASLFFTVNAGTCVILRSFGTSIVDKIPRPILGTVCITIMASALTAALRASSQTGLALCAVAYGIGMGYGFPVMIALIPDVYPPRLMPKGSSMGMLAMDLGFALSPLAIGAISSSLGLERAMLSMAWAQYAIAPAGLLMWREALSKKAIEL